MLRAACIAEAVSRAHLAAPPHPGPNPQTLVCRDIVENGSAGRGEYFLSLDVIEEEAARAEQLKKEGRVRVPPAPAQPPHPALAPAWAQEAAGACNAHEFPILGRLQPRKRLIALFKPRPGSQGRLPHPSRVIGGADAMVRGPSLLPGIYVEAFGCRGWAYGVQHDRPSGFCIVWQMTDGPPWGRQDVELEAVEAVVLEGVEIIPCNDKRLHGRSQRRNKAQVRAWSLRPPATTPPLQAVSCLQLVCDAACAAVALGWHMPLHRPLICTR